MAKGDPIPCRGCGAPITFLQNTETGKYMPIDVETGEPHWKSCTKAGEFRKTKNPPTTKPDIDTVVVLRREIKGLMKRMDNLEEDVSEILKRLGEDL